MPLVSSIEIRLSAAERTELERTVRSQTAPARDVVRARVVLALADNLNIGRVARDLRLARATVRKWGTRFERRRLAGLADSKRPGRPPGFSPRSGHVRDEARLRAA